MSASENPGKVVSLRGVLLKSSAVMFVTLALIKVSGYLFNMVFARYFPQESYGNFVYLWSLAMALVGFMCLEVGGATSRYIAFYRGEGSERKVYDVYATGFWLSVMVVAVSLPILLLLHRTGLFGIDNMGFLFIAGLFVMHCTANLFVQITSGFRKPEVSTFLGLLLNLLKMAAVVLAVVLGLTYGGLLGLVAVGFLLYTLASVAYPLWAFGFKGSFRGGYAAMLVRFGLPLILVTTASNLLAWADIFLIRHFMGDVSVAVYNVAWLTATAPLIFFSSVVLIFNPVVTELFGKKDYKRAGRLSSYVMELFFLLFMPVFVAVISFAREIIVLFFKVEYLPAVAPLQGLAFGIFMFGLSMLYKELFTAYGRPGLNAAIIGVAAAVNVALNYVLIPPLGIMGAVYATILSSAVIWLLSHFAAVRVIGVVSIAPSYSRIIKIVFSSLLIVPVVYAVKAAVENSIASLVVSSASAFIVYVAALLLLKSLSPMDLEVAGQLMDGAGLGSLKKSVLELMSLGCGR